MEINLVQYNVINNNEIVVSGVCPTYFINTIAHMYLMYDTPDPSVYIEFIHNTNTFKVYAPTI